MSARPGDLPVLPTTAKPGNEEPRTRAIERARLLAWVGLGWHAVEAAVAIAAGVIASSIALVGFGADSLIELLAGVIVLWRLASGVRERRAQQLIAVSFYALSLYVTYEAIHTLAVEIHPQVSWIGIGLSIVTLATMPPLAIAKQRVAVALDSSAVSSESRQTMLCAYLSAGLLIGLVLNAALGWWWADPLTALGIAAAAAREGRNAWRGESCCTTAVSRAREAPLTQLRLTWVVGPLPGGRARRLHGAAGRERGDRPWGRTGFSENAGDGQSTIA